jgi:hypothetical protein
MADNPKSSDKGPATPSATEGDPFLLTSSVNDSILIRDLPEGATVHLRNGATAEVTGNPRDGGWLFIKYVEHPKDPSLVGTEDMAYCVDVIGAL